MTRTETVKHIGETLVDRAKTPILAAVGAGDLAMERALTAVGRVRSRAESLPGDAQVQADLAVKEARTRADEARTRATEAVGRTRTAAQQVAAVAHPETVRSTVQGLVGTARTQAASTVEALASRGEKVVDELRRQPGFKRVVRRTENAVDTVQSRVDDGLKGSAGTVSGAADEVTSLAQKTAGRANRTAERAEKQVAEAAQSAKSTVDKAAPAAPAKRAPARKNTTAARKATPAKASARVGRARTAKPADPTAVPTKRTR
jgi:heparin binding hemagglutinin HbhA